MSNREDKVNCLYDKYYSYLLFCAKRILGVDASVEDYVQDTFYRLLSDGNLDKIKDIDSKRARNYLIKILVNVIITAKNRRHIDVEFNESFFYPKEMTADPTWDRYACGEIKAKLRTLVLSLPVNDKILLSYRYAMALSYYEISKLMGTSVKYTTSRLNKIEKKLLKGIAEENKSYEKG